jgi:hypothetical protein
MIEEVNVNITAPQWMTPPGILAQLKANAPVSISLQAQGLVRYFLDGGMLPAGLSLSDNGSISGLANQPGSFDFIICACNGVSRSARNFCLVVQA